MPHHHGKSRKQLHSRLWPHHRLSRRHRLRHPRRRRHGLFRARSSRASTIRCWRRSPPGRRPPRRSSRRMDRALARIPHPRRRHQPRLSGSVLDHPKFRANDYTTRFIDETPELFDLSSSAATARPSFSPRSPTSRVNGHPETRGPRQAAGRCARAGGAVLSRARARAGDQATFDQPGRRRTSPTGCATRSACSITDTTMRDAHQSLLATRMRTHDIAAVAGGLCQRAAAASVAGMLGRRHLRCGDALPDRRPVGAAGADAREGAQSS